MELILYKKEKRQKPNKYLVLCKDQLSTFKEIKGREGQSDIFVHRMDRESLFEEVRVEQTFRSMFEASDKTMGL